MPNYQQKEMKTYCANELFKTRAQTTKLYSEFNSVKAMRDEMRDLARQASLLDGDRTASLEAMVGKLDS